MKTKIEWCDDVLNPAWGCGNNCPYCYAKKFAKRIGRRIGKLRGYSEDIIQKMINFEPVLFPDYERIIEKVCETKKTKKIFINSMSGIEYWKFEWMQKIIKKCEDYPQYKFLLLTKNPLAYNDYIFPDNFLLGCTITNNEKLEKVRGYFNFISFEPLLTEIDINLIPKVRWIIIGAETGNRKNKIIPKYEWIYNIYRYCTENKIPLFMKDNLRNISSILIQEFPK